jgi:mannose-6-phosphate isomerase-like protein (cupin superfamily)
MIFNSHSSILVFIMSSENIPFARADGLLSAVNPHTGDRLVVLRPAAASGGATTLLRFTLPPGASGAPAHRHARLTERFTVVSGRLAMAAGDLRRTRILGPGESLQVGPGEPHRFWNPHGEEVTFTSEVSPGADFERFIRVHYGLAIAGLTGASGMPRNPLHVALLLEWADFEVPGVPSVVQRAVRGVLTALARRVGSDRALAAHAV